MHLVGPALLSWTLWADPVVAAAGAAEPEPTLVATEVVRVKRDFGKPHFDLVIDAWTDGTSTRLHRTRLWWTNTNEADRRKPLGPLVERMVKLQYRRISPTSLTVAVAGDGKEFTFTVERAEDGQVSAYVSVDTDAGRHVPRCRTESARLLARRVLGMPVGISKITVTCKDSGGAVHRGQIRHKEI
jgi:hypothetical protein